jgi:hypothetical protein
MRNLIKSISSFFCSIKCRSEIGTVGIIFGQLFNNVLENLNTNYKDVRMKGEEKKRKEKKKKNLQH